MQRRGRHVKLYTYFRSSAAYRVRIALNLKGIATEQVFIHLTKDGGRQHSPEYRAVNPQRRVPTLVLDSGDVLMQSPAIIDYLDEVHPKPPLLPSDPLQRGRSGRSRPSSRCDIHPHSTTWRRCNTAPPAEARAAGDRCLVSSLDHRGFTALGNHDPDAGPIAGAASDIG